jgi:hypothetical protein
LPDWCRFADQIPTRERAATTFVLLNNIPAPSLVLLGGGWRAVLLFILDYVYNVNTIVIIRNKGKVWRDKQIPTSNTGF